jgi:hypothetical protein
VVVLVAVVVVVVVLVVVVVGGDLVVLVVEGTVVVVVPRCRLAATPVTPAPSPLFAAVAVVAAPVTEAAEIATTTAYLAPQFLAALRLRPVAYAVPTSVTWPTSYSVLEITSAPRIIAALAGRGTIPHLRALARTRLAHRSGRELAHRPRP